MAKRKLQLLIDAKNNTKKGFGEVDSSLNKFQSSLIRIGKTMGLAFGVMALKRFAGESVRLYGIQEQAEARLETIMKRVNHANDEQVAGLKDYASQLQQVTLFGDEQTISAMAMLGTFQLNTDQIKQLTPRILDMGAAMEKSTGTGADLESITIAVGKAMTSGIGSLTRYGVVINDTQREAFDLADKQEKVRILTEALDANFSGIAEGSAKTLTGGIKQLKNTMGDLREQTGLAALVFSREMVFALGVNIQGMTENEKATHGMMISTNKLKLGVYSLGLAFLEVYGKFQNFSSLIGKYTFGAFNDVLGDGVEGMKYFQDQIDDVNKKTANYELTVGELALEIDNMNKELQSGTFNWDDYLGKLKDAGSAGMDFGNSMGEGVGKSQKEMDKFGQTLDKYKNQVVSFADKSVSALESVVGKIQDINQKMQELNNDRATGRLGIKKEFAQAYVDQEKKISDLELKIQAETDQSKRDVLSVELEREKEALEKRRHLEEIYVNEINDLRRRASMTEFDRMVEDLNIKGAKLEEELAMKQQKIETELNLELQKFNKIKELQDLSLLQIDKFLAQGERMTTESINREIEKYNQLAKAISAAKSGKTSGFVSFGVRVVEKVKALAEGGIVTRPTLAMIGEGGESEAVIPLSKMNSVGVGGGGITINIDKVYGTSREAAAKFSREIIKDIKRQIRIS